jgi:hypothetical protein
MILTVIEPASLPVVQLRKCKQCKTVLPLSEYGRESTTARRVALGFINYKTKCKVCLRENQKGTRAAKRALERPVAGYECPGDCGRVYDPDTATTRSWVPDHDNQTHMVRKYLCRECNTTLGKSDDDPMRILGLMCYLGEHGKPIDLALVHVRLEQAVAKSKAIRDDIFSLVA